MSHREAGTANSNQYWVFSHFDLFATRGANDNWTCRPLWLHDTSPWRHQCDTWRMGLRWSQWSAGEGLVMGVCTGYYSVWLHAEGVCETTRHHPKHNNPAKQCGEKLVPIWGTCRSPEANNVPQWKAQSSFIWSIFIALIWLSVDNPATTRFGTWISWLDSVISGLKGVWITKGWLC